MLGSFIDKNGLIIGSDGINDRKIYVLKTTISVYNGSGKEAVPGAGLSKKDLKAAIKFIKNNSDNEAAFTNNDIAYRSSFEVTNSRKAWEGMFAEADRDNGKGGESLANNREYGGYVTNDGFEPVAPGPVVDPSKGRASLHIDPSRGSTSYNHSSGDKVVIEKQGTLSITATTYSQTQHPSISDINKSGSYLHYEHAQGENKIYFFNKTGILGVVDNQNFRRFIRTLTPIN